jgi:uncharacterized protein YndB with AHSA1/START domain
MTSPPDATVCVARRFAAAPDRVFDAWLDPAMIGRFMFGPALRDEEVLHLEIDARVGGAFSFLVRRAGTQIDHVGTYRQIDRPRRLVFTWGIAGESSDESLVTIDIAPLDTGCELALTHSMDPKWKDYAERTQAGWTRTIGALATALETNQA